MNACGVKSFRTRVIVFWRVAPTTKKKMSSVHYFPQKPMFSFEFPGFLCGLHARRSVNFSISATFRLGFVFCLSFQVSSRDNYGKMLLVMNYYPKQRLISAWRAKSHSEKERFRRGSFRMYEDLNPARSRNDLCDGMNVVYYKRTFCIYNQA